MRFADFRSFLRESANPFINLCSKFGNSIKGKSIMTRVISDYGSGKKELKSTKTDASLYNGEPSYTGSMCHSGGFTFNMSSIPKVKNEVSVENVHKTSNASNTKYSNMREEFKSINKLYHFTKFDTAIKILGSHSLKFGKLSNMNDIHENDKLSYVDFSGNPIHYFPSDILETIDNEIAKYRQISLTIDDEGQYKLGFDLHQMWGLYADKGQGVCLVFDKDILCSKLDDIVRHGTVSYDKNVESFYIANHNDCQIVQHDMQNQVEKLFFHKREEWEHEQEYRLIKYCPNLKKEEYLDYGDALKYIILNSVIESVDSIKFKEMVRKLSEYAPQAPILVYGNGLFDYSLIDKNQTETIWTSSNGYDIPIPGEYCEIDV